MSFKSNGIFNGGFFINETEEKFFDKFKSGISEFIESSTNVLILIHGNLSNDQKEILEKSVLNRTSYTIFEVFYSSLVRIFSLNEQMKVTNKNIKVGVGILLDNYVHLISYEHTRGTQVCIKLKQISSNIKEKNNFYEIVFQLTQYNPSFFRNSTKLPYPIHCSSQSNKLGLRIGLKSFKFYNPFYF